MTVNNDRHPNGDDPFDRLFRALSHRTRRRILASLLKQSKLDVFGSMGVTPDGGEDTPTEIRLYHQHLPHLDQAGFIDWDRETATVKRGPQFDEIRSLLSVMDKHGNERLQDWS